MLGVDEVFDVLCAYTVGPAPKQACQPLDVRTQKI